MKAKQKPVFNKRIFWDVNFEQIDYDAKARYVKIVDPKETKVSFRQEIYDEKVGIYPEDRCRFSCLILYDKKRM